MWLDSPTLPANIGHLRTFLRALALPNLTGHTPIDIPPAYFTPGTENAAFEALGQFFSHSWFEWIWVILEVAMRKTVHVMYRGI
jgi:hypothetical protein